MKIVRFLVMVLSVLLFCSLVSCNSKLEVKVIKVGFIGPLTGDAATYGINMSRAVQIALEERNELKAVEGKTLVLVTEDTEGKTEKSKAAVQKLTGLDNVTGLVGDVFNPGSLAIRDTIQATKTLTLTPSSTVKGLTDNYSYFFRTIASDGLQAEVFGRYIAKELKIQNLAILYTKTEYSQMLAEGVKAVFEAAGGKVVVYEAGELGAKNWKVQLAKVKAAKVDALFLPNAVAETTQILKQASQFGLQQQVLSSDGFSNPEVLKLAGKLAEGVIYSGPVQDAAGPSEKTKEFIARYKAQFGGEPDSFTLNAYDGANILVDAIVYSWGKASAAERWSATLDRVEMQKYVAGIRDYPGVTGIISYGSANGDPIKPVGIWTVRSGKFEQTAVYKVDNGVLEKVQ